MTKPRTFYLSSLEQEMAEDGILVCQCCEKPLKVGRVHWLELNCMTNEWAEPGLAEWSDTEHSQGCFPFGKTCANKQLSA